MVFYSVWYNNTVEQDKHQRKRKKELAVVIPELENNGLRILGRMIARSIINQSVKNHEANHKENGATIADIDG